MMSFSDEKGIFEKMTLFTGGMGGNPSPPAEILLILILMLSIHRKLFLALKKVQMVRITPPQCRFLEIDSLLFSNLCVKLGFNKHRKVSLPKMG